MAESYACPQATAPGAGGRDARITVTSMPS
jgi:hypothetical protein